MSTNRPDPATEIYGWHGLPHHKNGPIYVLPVRADVDRVRANSSLLTVITFSTKSPSFEAMEPFYGKNVAVVTGDGSAENNEACRVAKYIHRFDGRVELVRPPEMNTTIAGWIATPAGVMEMRRAAHKQFGLSDPDTMDPIWRKQSSYTPGPAAEDGKAAGGKNTGTGGGKGNDGSGQATGELVFQRLADIPVVSVKWLVPGRIPAGTLTLIAAEGGLGKSTMMRHVIARVTRGLSAFGLTYKCEPGEVILLAAEDSYESVVVPHLIAEGADLNRVHRVNYVVTGQDGKKTTIHLNASHIERLKDELKKRPGVKLIVIDPAASFAARSGLNENKANELRSVLDPLSDLANETGIAVVVIAHLNKGTSDNAAHRVAGSTAYVNASRLVYLLAKDPHDDDRRVLAPIKKNLLGVTSDAATFKLDPLDLLRQEELRDHPSMRGLAREDYDAVVKDLSVVTFGENVAVNANDLAGAKKEKDPTKVAKCGEWLKTFLAVNAYPSAELVLFGKDLGFNFDTVKTARESLKPDLRSHKNGKGENGKGEWWVGFGPESEWARRPESASYVAKHSPPSSTSSPPFPSSPSSTSSSFTEEGKQGEEGNEGKQVEEGSPLNWPGLDDLEAHNRSITADKRKPRKGVAA